MEATYPIDESAGTAIIFLSGVNIFLFFNSLIVNSFVDLLV